MDGGAWWAAVHGVPKSRTRLSDFTSTFHFHALEKEMATHSSALAWRIPGMGEPGGLPSLGSHRVGHDWSDLAAAAAARGHSGFPSGSVVKTLPANQETQVWSLGWEDALEKGMAICSSIFAWEIPWTEEPSGLQSMGLQRVGYDWAHTHTHTHTQRPFYVPGESLFYWSTIDLPRCVSFCCIVKWLGYTLRPHRL